MSYCSKLLLKIGLPWPSPVVSPIRDWNYMHRISLSKNCSMFNHFIFSWSIFFLKKTATTLRQKTIRRPAQAQRPRGQKPGRAERMLWFVTKCKQTNELGRPMTTNYILWFHHLIVFLANQNIYSQLNGTVLRCTLQLPVATNSH